LAPASSGPGEQTLGWRKTGEEKLATGEKKKGTTDQVIDGVLENKGKNIVG